MGSVHRSITRAILSNVKLNLSRRIDRTQRGKVLIRCRQRFREIVAPYLQLLNCGTRSIARAAGVTGNPVRC